MSAVGIDFGSLNSVLAATRGRGVETLLNEFSSRLNPGLVYLESTRVIGESAKPQSITRNQNTVTQFKRLVGCKYSDPHAQKELALAFFKHSELEDGSIGIHLQYQDEEHIFTPEQICAMFFSKLKSIVEKELKKNIGTLVMSCPCWFTDAQRQALRAACSFANVPCARIFNDTTAVALTYGIYKDDLPEKDPRVVAFVDVGQSSLQVAIVGLVKGKMKVIGTTYDAYLGGRDFDDRLLKHFAGVFKEKTKVDLYEKPRALLRLRSECEKTKKLMSANSQRVALNIECLHGDHDFQSGIARPEFEEMCSDLFERVEKTLVESLQYCKKEDLFAVEIVGGASRIPKIKAIIEQVYGKAPSTTLNADETVARGAAWQAAFHSPTHRPREFASSDTLPYSIDLAWKSFDEEGKPIDSEKTVFDVNQSIPSTKWLTFYRSEPFELTARYTNKEANVTNQSFIGTFTINGVKPNSEGKNSLVKVKLRINQDGVFTIPDAHTVEEIMVAPEPKPAAAPATEGENAEENKDMDVESPKPVKKTVKTDLLVVSSPYFSEAKIAEYTQKEADMNQHDENELARMAVKNAVEELSYELRDRLEDQYKPFVVEEKVDEINTLLDDVVDWLYGEGENCTKAEYDAKLDSMKFISEPLAFRFRESELRPTAVNNLKKAIDFARNAVILHSENNEKYAHLSAEDIGKVASELEAKEAWLQTKLEEQEKQPKTETPVVLCADIDMATKQLNNVVTPILNKPKPKVPTPSPSPAPESPKPEAKAEGTPEPTPPADPAPTGADMEVD